MHPVNIIIYHFITSLMYVHMVCYDTISAKLAREQSALIRFNMEIVADLFWGSEEDPSQDLNSQFWISSVSFQIGIHYYQ
jgi:hypothetical protein